MSQPCPAGTPHRGLYHLMLSFPGGGEKWGGDGARANVKAPETVELPQPLHRKSGGTED